MPDWLSAVLAAVALRSRLPGLLDRSADQPEHDHVQPDVQEVAVQERGGDRAEDGAPLLSAAHVKRGQGQADDDKHQREHEVLVDDAAGTPGEADEEGQAPQVVGHQGDTG